MQAGKPPPALVDELRGSHRLPTAHGRSNQRHRRLALSNCHRTRGHCYSRLRSSDDFEGVEAFHDKRRAPFAGTWSSWFFPGFPPDRLTTNHPTRGDTYDNRAPCIALAIACIASAAARSTHPYRRRDATVSGTYAGGGQQVKWGLDLAARQINACAGGNGQSSSNWSMRREANPAVAVQAEKLFQVNKGRLHDGTQINSSATLAVESGLPERNNRLLQPPSPSRDFITGGGAPPNVFRVGARAGSTGDQLRTGRLDG